ncbi:MAG: hypothetical protein VKL59_18445 [Nostocaceae cyanobacterium]|nr:hypothetical protein [Nostocaceae cyanobacterium]
MDAAAETNTYTSETYTTENYDKYDRYYKRACEVCVPIILKVPVFVAPIVIEKEPKCVEKNGY